MCIVLWGFLRGSSTKCWVSQGFPWVSSAVASVFEAQSKERAKFLRGVNVHCSKAVSEGFLCKVLGFPGVPWVSCTVASVFEPESKERVVFLRVSHGFPKRFPWVSTVSSTFCWLCCFGLLFWVCGPLCCFEPQVILRN